VVIVAHIIDVAHDLNVQPPELLLDPTALKERAAALSALFESRVRLRADGTLLTAGMWSTPEALAERQSIRLAGNFPLRTPPGMLTLNASMFPYDPQHQTFINFYEADTLALQAILDTSKTSVEFFSGSRQGIAAVVRRFVPSGIEHILIGRTTCSFWSAFSCSGERCGNWHLSSVRSRWRIASPSRSLLSVW